MEIYSSIWHLISAFCFFLLGGICSILIAKRFFSSPLKAITLYLWHTFFSIVYFWYVINFGGDAIGYFEEASTGNIQFSVGTGSITYLTGLLVNVIGVSILGAFLFFNFFGVVGLLAFDASLRFATKNKSKSVQNLACLIIFLPSVSFWSSAIGKDSLSFMSSGLALWAALEINRRWLLMAFTVAVMFLVRPHVAGLMVLAWTFAILLSYKTPLAKKAVLGFLSGIAALVMIPFAIQYAGVGEIVNAVELMAYIDQRQTYNNEGAGGMDIASMSLPMKLYSYMLRPAFFEVNSIFELAAAFDNFVMLCLFIAGVWAILCGRDSCLGESRIFMWTYSLMAWLMLSTTTANLGIALRQKWMFAPMLIFLFISIINVKKTKKVL